MQFCDRAANVAAEQSDVLGTGSAVKIDVFLDLRFAAFALGGFVDREFDIVLAVDITIDIRAEYSVEMSLSSNVM